MVGGYSYRNGTFQKRPCLVPSGPQNTHRSSDGLSRQRHVNAKSLEEDCEPTAVLSPWHSNLFHSMLRAIDSQNTGMQQGLELATVEVSPLTLGSMIVARQRL